MSPSPRDDRATEPSPTRTRELLERWRGGSAEAGERLAGRHLALLRARARRHPLSARLGPGADPEDLAQDTLERALRSGFVERFEDRGPGSLRNALYRVLDRTILDGLRRGRTRKRTPNAGDLPRDGTPGAVPPTASAIVDHREPSPTSQARTNDWIERCRSLLTEREWTVWSAVEVEGRGPGEVASELSITESAARGLLFRARGRILRALAEPEA